MWNALGACLKQSHRSIQIGEFSFSKCSISSIQFKFSLTKGSGLLKVGHTSERLVDDWMKLDCIFGTLLSGNNQYFALEAAIPDQHGDVPFRSTCLSGLSTNSILLW